MEQEPLKLLRKLATGQWQPLDNHEQAIAALKQLGFTIEHSQNHQIRLKNPIELLEFNKIISNMDQTTTEQIDRIDLFDSIDSTNTYLRKNLNQHPINKLQICLAEQQTAGRGRWGRDWISPLASNLYLSLGWWFPLQPIQLSGLSQAIGLGVADALSERDAQLKLKWPNDIYWKGRKLGGILIELAQQKEGYCRVIVGIGINISMPKTCAESINRPWVDLTTLPDMQAVSRNQIAANVATKCLQIFKKFSACGMSPFIEQWRHRDMLFGQSVTLQLPNRTVIGQAVGIDDHGRLLIQKDGRLTSYDAGEASLGVVGNVVTD